MGRCCSPRPVTICPYTTYLVMSRMQEVPIIGNYNDCEGSNSGWVAEGNKVDHNSDDHEDSSFTYGDSSNLGTSDGDILPFVVA